jgi:hypothetical protein
VTATTTARKHHKVSLTPTPSDTPTPSVSPTPTPSTT